MVSVGRVSNFTGEFTSSNPTFSDYDGRFLRVNRSIDIPASFVFNVDESGCCEYADRREVRVLVPDDYEGDSIPVPVDRHSNRSTLVACITADGFRFKPFAIIDRVNAEKELLMFGYHARNCALNFQENAYMNTPSPEKY
jgi:hypothetical protein